MPSPGDGTARQTVGAALSRPRRQCRRTMTLRPLYQYVDSLPRPVTYHSETGLHTSTVGVDERVDPSGAAALPPLEGEVPNEREAEGFVRQQSKKTPQSARSG